MAIKRKAKLPKYNTAFTVGLSLNHDFEDPVDVPVALLLGAMADRLRQISEEPPDTARASFEDFDTYTNDWYVPEEVANTVVELTEHLSNVTASLESCLVWYEAEMPAQDKHSRNELVSAAKALLAKLEQ